MAHSSAARSRTRRPTSALISAATPRPAARGEAREVDPVERVVLEQLDRRGHGRVDAGHLRVGRRQHRADHVVVELETGQALQGARGEGVGVDRDGADHRDGQAEVAGPSHEVAGLRRRAHVVEHDEVSARMLLLHDPGRPERDGRGGGCLRDGDAQPLRGGEGREPGAVEVEHLGRLGADPRRPAVPGHAQHAVDPDVSQAGELLLEHHAVAVAAGQGHPRRPARGPNQTREHGRREVGLVLVLADQHRVARPRKHADGVEHRAGVVRRHGQVAQHDRTAVADRVEDHAGRRGRGVLDAPVGREGRPRRRRGTAGEGAGPAVDLARQVAAHAAARAEDHVLGAGRLRGHHPIMPRRCGPCSRPLLAARSGARRFRISSTAAVATRQCTSFLCSARTPHRWAPDRPGRGRTRLPGRRRGTVARMQELLLVRHGESEGNLAAARANADGVEVIDVPARDPDVELSDLGREQAAALGAALESLPPGERPEVLVCSPYVRARETARIACEAAGLDLPELVDERLRDRELGVLDRLTESGVRARHPDEHDRRRWQGKFYHRPAGGESWADVVLRLRSWVADAERELAATRVLLVSHDVVIALLRYVYEGMDEDSVLHLARETPMRNAALSRFVRDDGMAWSVAAYDDVAHLRAAGLPVTEHQGARRAGT